MSVVFKGLTFFFMMALIINVSQFSCTKVHLFFEDSCAILISFKIVVIFNIKSADFVDSDDVVLKMTTILKEMRIAQLGS